MPKREELSRNAATAVNGFWPKSPQCLGFSEPQETAGEGCEQENGGARESGIKPEH